MTREAIILAITQWRLDYHAGKISGRTFGYNAMRLITRAQAAGILDQEHI